VNDTFGKHAEGGRGPFRGTVSAVAWRDVGRSGKTPGKMRTGPPVEYESETLKFEASVAVHLLQFAVFTGSS